MSTNFEVIRGSLRELNVISEVDDPSAEQGVYCLGILNDLMEEWTENDIDLGYFAQESTTDDCPIPPYAMSGVKSNLAVAVASNFGASVSPELALKAQTGYETILRKSIVAKLQPADMSHMPVGTGQLWRSDIINDE